MTSQKGKGKGKTFSLTLTNAKNRTHSIEAEGQNMELLFEAFRNIKIFRFGANWSACLPWTSQFPFASPAIERN